MSMRFLPCGDSAVLVELDDLDAVLALHAELVGDTPPGVVDLVPAARTLLLRVDSRQTGVDAVTRAVAAVRLGTGRQREARTVEIPVIYDGEDLYEVGRLTGLGERGVVAAHTGQTWTVAFAGFAPGFGYLVGEDDRLHVPRRANPRTRVPAGAVGLAGEFSGIYPRESPGGWQLLGRTHRRMWDPQRNPPSLLAPGIRVRFVEVPAR
ncbi:5-oxoprolinase subunit PxpB [Planosporangium mesophilum]|uniref:Allophanate hydrolase n=1 Tax=Planosporangium mesophilum TaxID=689768 RepID=A0A8J3T8Z4_9ACTN|nr:5-oxoprolinase subunit PxpB [Planosporangium mesophilum]GII22735.1 allophanate hydrolase [Planosporangium mesophilum]